MLLQLRERVLQRQQGAYILTVEAGRSLLLTADGRVESALQTELMDTQERWRHAHQRLDQQRRELHGLLKVGGVWVVLSGGSGVGAVCVGCGWCVVWVVFPVVWLVCWVWVVVWVVYGCCVGAR